MKWTLLLCLAVVATNRYEAPPADWTFVPDDSYSYLTIAESAPALPQERLPFHHAQRLAIPHLVGMFHHAIPMSIHRLFQISVVLIELGILLVVAGVLGDLSVRGRQANLALALAALNPWAFRAYLTYPEMICLAI